jgi:hypothetical protein
MNDQLLDMKLRRLRAKDKLTGERATFALGTDPVVAEEAALNHVRRDPWGIAPVDFAPADPAVAARIRERTRSAEKRRPLYAIVADLRERLEDDATALLVDADDLRRILMELP